MYKDSTTTTTTTVTTQEAREVDCERDTMTRGGGSKIERSRGSGNASNPSVTNDTSRAMSNHIDTNMKHFFWLPILWIMAPPSQLHINKDHPFYIGNDLITCQVFSVGMRGQLLLFRMDVHPHVAELPTPLHHVFW